MVDTILSRHDYPEPVSQLLGEAVALTALLGAALKFEGKFILQASTDGPVDLLVADYQVPGGLRGYARFSAGASGGAAARRTLLGEGHLAMTIDRGAETERYQGVVPLEGESLTEAADIYFRQSEQLADLHQARRGAPLSRRARRAAGRGPGARVACSCRSSRREGGRGPAVKARFAEEDWTRAKALAETVEDHELLDPDAAARPAALPAVPRGAGARLSRRSARELLQLLAGARRGAAQALLGRGSRRNGGRRRSVGDVRVLQPPLQFRSRSSLR